MSDHCLIPLGKGKRGYALVSPEDYERVSQYNWTRDKNGYVVRTETTVDEHGNKYRRKIMLHRFILGTPDGMDVDHRFGDRLDNRRSEIRQATRSQNAANSPARKGQYKGVFFRQDRNKWRAEIIVNRCKRNLGSFATAESAAAAYDLAALEAWGEFAYLNFPEHRQTYAQAITATRYLRALRCIRTTSVSTS